MKTMTRSLHLAGGITALLVASALTSFGATNAVPHSWDFEGYSNGTNIADTTGTDGWYGDDSANVFVATNATYPAPGNGYPMETTHEIYASMTGPVTNAITGGAGGMVWIDHMVKPERWKQAESPSDLPTDTQMAYYVNTNDHLVIYHLGVDTNANGDAMSNIWTEIDSSSVGSDDWVRVSIGMDYEIHDTQRRYYQLQIDGTLVTHEEGKVDPTYVADPLKFPDYSGGGSYFAMAYDAGVQLNSIVMKGNGLFDDFVVSTNDPLFHITHIVMAQVIAGASGGTLNPEGTCIIEDGSNQVFIVTAENYWTIDKVIVVENGITTTNTPTASPYTNTFASVTNAGSIDVYFAADVATNGVPHWWLVDSGLTTNDADATGNSDSDDFSNLQEWISSTDPLDGNSFLRISNTWQDNGTNYVQWESVYIDAELPAFDMMASTNMTASNSFSSVGTVVRGATNTWSGEIPKEGTFYKVSAPTTP